MLNTNAKSLNLLDLSYTDLGFETETILEKSLPKLATLVLSECSQLSDSGLYTILDKSGPNIEILKLNVTNVSLKSIDLHTQKLVKLKHIDLSNCIRITDDILSLILSRTCQTVTYINLSFSNIKTFKFKYKDCVTFHRLRTLILNGCEKLTDSGLSGKSLK